MSRLADIARLFRLSFSWYGNAYDRVWVYTNGTEGALDGLDGAAVEATVGSTVALGHLEDTVVATTRLDTSLDSRHGSLSSAEVARPRARRAFLRASYTGGWVVLSRTV